MNDKTAKSFLKKNGCVILKFITALAITLISIYETL